MITFDLYPVGFDLYPVVLDLYPVMLDKNQFVVRCCNFDLMVKD